MLDNLKKFSGYYNFQKRDARRVSFRRSNMGAVAGCAELCDVGRDADGSDGLCRCDRIHVHVPHEWCCHPPATGPVSFGLGERVRLRFINAAAMTFYDVRIPGLTMTVVQADGQNVQPVTVDEFRFGPAETYDVIVQPTEDRAYTIFAETMDRSGYARGTLATRPGMEGEIPERRARPLRTMEDMGMGDHGNGILPCHGEVRMKSLTAIRSHGMMHGEGKHGPEGHGRDRSPIPGAIPVKHGPDHHGTGNQTVAEYSQNGCTNRAEDSNRAPGVSSSTPT